MKRLILLALALVFACLALCGCGGIRNDMSAQKPSVTMDLIPEPSPVITPDLDDGVVTDRDGVIEEREPGASAAPTLRPSASPTVSAKP